ncbi:hypothetical protein LSUE1_G004168 [Lachnellula suecica]|uniref:CENP-V/GFA domain-containing protein n=1 Tax=Lachnellula suecica TaxID=602035 RepID=A0A8T9CAA4_9HELO|nr:hypothetical protein LSUE1_G004168 [Lachnellula suecica]
MAKTAPKRQACPGSCHCGLTKYIVFLTLPHPFSSSNPPKWAEQEIYRCNCTVCHKMGFLHVNPAHPRDDFMLLSPLDPDRDLNIYRCCDKKQKYYFCPRCGVRCFTLGGESETVVIDFKDLVDGKEKKREVWRAKWDGEKDTEPYVSVNGTTIDAREDLDLRVLTEEKRVQYFDGRSEPEKEKEPRWDRPHDGGSY